MSGDTPEAASLTAMLGRRGELHTQESVASDSAASFRIEHSPGVWLS
jgi:hypothetical protein